MKKSARPEVLALIPARGGSKGIPRKNLLMLRGKPLIAHTIAQAKASRRITRVIVTTDDAEIAEVSRRYGAEVPFIRPARLAKDLSPDIDAFHHALDWLRKREDYRCELVVHLRPTGPVRRVEMIDEAVDMMLQDPRADALRSMSPAVQTPFKMWTIPGKFSRPLLKLPGVREPYCMPRQMLPQVYWQNGSLDIVRSRVILESRRMCGDRVIPFVMHEPILEIDYADCLPQVEAALRLLEKGKWPPKDAAKPRHAV